MANSNYTYVIDQLCILFTKSLKTLVEKSQPKGNGVNIKQHLLDVGINLMTSDSASIDNGMRNSLLSLCDNYASQGLFKTPVMGYQDPDKIYNAISKVPLNALKTECIACENLQSAFFKDLNSAFNAEILKVTVTLSHLYEEIDNELKEIAEKTTENFKPTFLEKMSGSEYKALAAEIQKAKKEASSSIIQEKMSKFMTMVPTVFNSYFHNMLATKRALFENASSSVKTETPDETIADHVDKYENDIALLRQAWDSKS